MNGKYKWDDRERDLQVNLWFNHLQMWNCFSSQAISTPLTTISKLTRQYDSSLWSRLINHGLQFKQNNSEEQQNMLQVVSSEAYTQHKSSSVCDARYLTRLFVPEHRWYWITSHLTSQWHAPTNADNFVLWSHNEWRLGCTYAQTLASETPSPLH